jgi:hypothetical protein
MTSTNLSPNSIITLDIWNNAVNKTAFTQLLPSSLGTLEAYTVASKNTLMNPTTSFATQYTSNKGIRSNYMDLVLNPASFAINTLSVVNSSKCSSVTTFNSYNTQLLQDAGTEQYGRIKGGFNTTNCTIQTPGRSLYIVYAEFRCNQAIVITDMCVLISNSNKDVANISPFIATTGFTANQVIGLQCQYLSESYAAETYSLKVLVNTASTFPVATLRFGYIELIGKGGECGVSLT